MDDGQESNKVDVENGPAYEVFCEHGVPNIFRESGMMMRDHALYAAAVSKSESWDRFLLDASDAISDGILSRINFGMFKRAVSHLSFAALQRHAREFLESIEVLDKRAQLPTQCRGCEHFEQHYEGAGSPAHSHCAHPSWSGKDVPWPGPFLDDDQGKGAPPDWCPLPEVS